MSNDSEKNQMQKETKKEVREVELSPRKTRKGKKIIIYDDSDDSSNTDSETEVKPEPVAEKAPKMSKKKIAEHMAAILAKQQETENYLSQLKLEREEAKKKRELNAKMKEERRLAKEQAKIDAEKPKEEKKPDVAKPKGKFVMW